MARVFFDSSKSARAFTMAEKAFVITVLNDPRAWPVGPWTIADKMEGAHWAVSLETQDYIDKLAGRSIGPGLSVTFMDRRPRKTLLSYENWVQVPGPVSKTYTLPQYRQYLILHECGHGLGLDHPKSTSGSGPAPIMLQHTKGLKNYQANLWPLLSEVEILKDVMKRSAKLH